MHISQLHKTIERGEFSISFVAKGGDVVTIHRCVMSSWHTLGNTFNVLLLDSRQLRKINRYTIISINNTEYFL